MDCLLGLRQDVRDATRQATFGLLAAQGRQWDRRYPFGDPVSADSSHVSLLASREYVVADKSDGVRACLVLSTSRAEAGGALAFHSAFLDRRGVLYGVSIHADAAFFNKGTVLDGELVADADNGFAYVVFDAALLAGVKLTCPLLERLALCRSTFVPAATSPVLRVLVKPMFLLQRDMAAFYSHVATLPYRTDGIILTPNTDAPAPPGTCEAIVKLKTCHTMDFQFQDGMLWFGDDRELFPITQLGLRFDVAQLRAVPNGVIVEMSPSVNKADTSAQIFLHFMQIRQDKHAPNAYMTVTRTLRSVRDDVSLDSILAAL